MLLYIMYTGTEHVVVHYVHWHRTCCCTLCTLAQNMLLYIMYTGTENGVVHFVHWHKNVEERNVVTQVKYIARFAFNKIRCT